MSVITAAPVPTDPPKVPTRWVHVNHKKLDEGFGCRPCYAASYVYDDLGLLNTAMDGNKGGQTYRLPGTDESEALAELERASREIENELDLCDLASADTVNAWAVARRRLREVQAEQSGGKP